VSVLAVSICRLPFVLLLLFLTGDDIGFGYRDNADYILLLFKNLRQGIGSTIGRQRDLVRIGRKPNQNQKQINRCLILYCTVLYCNEDGGCESDQRSSFT
jgi:hypothetical protein